MFFCGKSAKKVRRVRQDDTNFLSEISAGSLSSDEADFKEKDRSSKSGRSKREKRRSRQCSTESCESEREVSKRASHKERKSNGAGKTTRERSEHKDKKKHKEHSRKSRDREKGRSETRKGRSGYSEGKEPEMALRKSARIGEGAGFGQGALLSRKKVMPVDRETPIQSNSSVESLRRTNLIAKHTNTKLEALGKGNEVLIRRALHSNSILSESRETSSADQRDMEHSSVVSKQSNSLVESDDESDARLVEIAQRLGRKPSKSSRGEKTSFSDAEEVPESDAVTLASECTIAENSSGNETEVSYMIDYYDKVHFNRLLVKKMAKFLNKKHKS